ncbi:gp62 [Listeria phage P40]|uniref:gp62 n=1 Tax=Listeria phage P40 TaxID=560178 RepID=UPI000181990B|nr:gp62 [Listeria phage P40]ACI00422.1 gp62 [Listeria phage P40]
MLPFTNPKVTLSTNTLVPPKYPVTFLYFPSFFHNLSSVFVIVIRKTYHSSESR